MEAKQGERLQDQVANAVGQVGARITEFLAGNPLETDIGRMIVAATNAETVQTEDWQLIMGICDYIIDTPNGGRDALRAVRKILTDNGAKSPQTVLYTLTVLEAAVKNCGAGFASHVCKTEFLDELIKLVKKDTPPAVQERVLSLIQSWADALRRVPECAEVGVYYDDLKRRGIEFPATDLDTMAPIITPKRTVYTEDAPEAIAGNQERASSQQPGVYVTSHQVVVNEESIAKVQRDLSDSKKQAVSFLDFLKKVPPVDQITNNELLLMMKKIHDTTREMRDRTMALVQNITDNPVILTEVLEVNDLLSNALSAYEAYVNPPKPERDPSQPGPSSATAPPASARGGDGNHVFDQADVGLNVAAFNKTDPITDRVTDELESFLIGDKKPEKESVEKKNEDGL